MVFEDRISKYPGRWTLVREDGSSEIVTLVRNDEPIKAGTPINASTLNELSTVAGAINAKEEAVSAAQSSASESAKSKESASNAAISEKNSKASEENSKTLLQATKEYFDQVRTITIGAQGWYATPEALKAAVPVGENGWWAVVGTTDTIWTWDGDTSAWIDTRKEVDLSDYLTQDQIRKLLEQYMPLRPATADQLGGVKVGKNLTITPDGLLSGLDAVDSGAIVAANWPDGLSVISNVIGYIRFSNGIQICGGNASGTSVTFPVPFIDNKIIVSVYSFRSIAVTSTGVKSDGNNTVLGKIIAIGRWK